MISPLQMKQDYLLLKAHYPPVLQTGMTKIWLKDYQNIVFFISCGCKCERAHHAGAPVSQTSELPSPWPQPDPSGHSCRVASKISVVGF